MSENKDSEVLDYSLSRMIEKKLEKYFQMHNGAAVPSGLYGRVIKEIEKSLLKTTLIYTNQNQMKAAKILGINRNTLHKKLTELNIFNEDQ